MCSGHSLGSISDNFSGGMISLRAATSALNSIAKSLAIEAESWGGIVCILTPVSNMFGSGGPSSEDFSTESDSAGVVAARMLRVILELSIGDNGKWLNTSRQEMPW